MIVRMIVQPQTFTLCEKRAEETERRVVRRGGVADTL